MWPRPTPLWSREDRDGVSGSGVPPRAGVQRGRSSRSHMLVEQLKRADGTMTTGVDEFFTTYAQLYPDPAPSSRGTPVRGSGRGRKRPLR